MIIQCVSKLFYFMAHRLPYFPGKTRLLCFYSKFFAGIPVYSTYGVRMGLHLDDLTNRSAILGWYGNHVSDIVRRLEPGDVFIDIGANAGLYSLIAGQEVGNAGAVIAFEPQTRMCGQLLQNVAYNGLENILILSVGVSSDTHLVSFDSYDARHTGTSRPTSRGTRNVWLANVGRDVSLVKKVVGKKRVFIKIYTEGKELDVLYGLEDIIMNCNVRTVIVEIDEQNLKEFGAESGQVYRFLEEKGFHAVTSRSHRKGHYDEVFEKSCWSGI